MLTYILILADVVTIVQLVWSGSRKSRSFGSFGDLSMSARGAILVDKDSSAAKKGRCFSKPHVDAETFAPAVREGR